MKLDKITTADGEIIFSGSAKETRELLLRHGGTLEEIVLPTDRKEMAARLNQLRSDAVETVVGKEATEWKKAAESD